MDQKESQDNQQFQHNWLYSVLPISPGHAIQNQNNYQWIPEDEFVLSGYCRACDQAFAVPLPISEAGNIQPTKVGIPKWGCANPFPE